MPSADANGITIEYETSGDSTAPALLLIMGLGGQLVVWDEEFIRLLMAQGFFVIRFDNRDVGRSTWFQEAGPVDIAAAIGGHAKAPYLLSDMADDAAGLLDALGLRSAHVLGISMGGMIAQSLAIAHPHRVLSLVSIMSTTGDKAVGAPHSEAVNALLRPPAVDRAGAIEQAVETWQVLGSPGFPFHEDMIRTKAAESYDRANYPEGTGRQLLAIWESPDRTADLSRLDCPTLVIHGDADVLVDPSGGKATAAAIPGGELVMVPGMGHEIPPEMFGEVATLVGAHAHPHDRRL